MVYQKVCIHCKKSYESTSRGQRYCSDECCFKHQKKVKRQREVTAKTPEINKVQSRLYSMAHVVADLYLPKPEGWNAKDWRLHHKDGNIFNIDPQNLIWVPHRRHEQYHAQLSKVNCKEYGQILLQKPELLIDSNHEYDRAFDDAQKHDELLNSNVMNILSKYKIQKYSEIQLDDLFDDLDKLHMQFVTLGLKDFAQKIFHVKGKTALKEIFKDRGYLEVLESWLEESAHE